MIDATQHAFVIGFITGTLACFLWLLLLSRWYLNRVERKETTLVNADNQRLKAREAMSQ